jgi:hypothetical protein
VDVPLEQGEQGKQGVFSTKNISGRMTHFAILVYVRM